MLELQQYLKRELAKGTISFIIATHDYKNGNHWYIHPENKAGETFDIYFSELVSQIAGDAWEAAEKHIEEITYSFPPHELPNKEQYLQSLLNKEK